MSYVKLSHFLIQNYPEVIDALKARFERVREVPSLSDQYRKFELEGPEALGEDDCLNITFGKDNNGKLIIYNIDKF